MSYARIWVTRPDQAARVSVARTAPPSVHVTPLKTRGNWFAPSRRRHVFAADCTSLKTKGVAVFCEGGPLVRTVLYRTVAKTLSIGCPCGGDPSARPGMVKNLGPHERST
jgi:hypothetical protein